MRKVLNQHDDQLAEMDFKLREVEIENLELKEKLKNLEDLNDKEAFENDDWVEKVYKNMSSAGKKDFQNAFSVVSHSLKRGTINRLRKTRGINFSIPTAESPEVESDLKKQIMSLIKRSMLKVPGSEQHHC